MPDTDRKAVDDSYTWHKEGFTYTRRAEHGTQEPVATVRIGRDSCRDFALLMIESVRSLGFAARFVSGYLHVPLRDGLEYVGGGNSRGDLGIPSRLHSAKLVNSLP